ncbi:phosphoribosylpyrophosphate synthetase [bacterium]|mgnify:CR=1 FL=1|nr:phosphoribosylpyrophosphate synthetase [bacterium]
MKNAVVISTRSNINLSKEVVKNLDKPLCNVNIYNFADSEIAVEIKENIRKCEVFIIAGTTVSSNVNSDIMELMLLIDAVTRSSPEKITVIFPYFYYARQDRRIGRSPISGKVLADMLSNTGIDSVVCIDLHSLQTQGFFSNNVVCEHASALVTMMHHIKFNCYDCIVSADTGGVARARYFASLLELPLVIIDKRRNGPGESEVMNVIGDVVSKKCCIVDDMIDGGGTVCNAAFVLMNEGADSVDVVAVHGLFSGDSLIRIADAPINKVYVSDSIQFEDDNETTVTDKIRVVPISKLIAETIRRSCNGESLKALVK